MILRAPVERIHPCQVSLQRASRCITRRILRVQHARAATGDKAASHAIDRSRRIVCLLTTHGHGRDVCRGR